LATPRNGPEITRVDFGIDLLERFLVLASWRDIRFKFIVPVELIAGAMCAASFVSSSGDNSSTAFSISARLIMGILSKERFIFNH
jgi:hypothetical protein